MFISCACVCCSESVFQINDEHYLVTKCTDCQSHCLISCNDCRFAKTVPVWLEALCEAFCCVYQLCRQQLVSKRAVIQECPCLRCFTHPFVLISIFLGIIKGIHSFSKQREYFFYPYEQHMGLHNQSCSSGWPSIVLGKISKFEKGVRNLTDSSSPELLKSVLSLSVWHQFL